MEIKVGLYYVVSQLIEITFAMKTKMKMKYTFALELFNLSTQNLTVMYSAQLMIFTFQMISHYIDAIF